MARERLALTGLVVVALVAITAMFLRATLEMRVSDVVEVEVSTSK